ncbi:MAG TPA: hypothetical protein VH583_04125 [Vicinamibacterales bacterium]|jgi:hypothetical protein
MRRPFSSFVLAAIFAVGCAPMASAQQSVDFYMGGFVPTSMSSRGVDDVLFQNSSFLSTLNSTNGIDLDQFNNFTFGGDYLVALGHYFEAGGGIGFYQKTVTTTYTNFVNANGTEIFQDLQLRIVPFSATFRVLPFGHNNGVEPYVGAGVGVFAWRYSETGQFVDANSNIFNGNFVGSGATVGPMVLGGVRFPVGPMSFGGEIRWQSASADLPPDQTFAGSKINLGGFNYLFNMGFRF